MAARKKQRKWGKNPRHSAAAEDPHVQRANPPKQRLKKLLDLPRQAAVASESLLFGMPLPADEAQRALVQFEVGMLSRGTNALKSVATLCGDGHWEFAVGIVRQLFELVLNLEYLDAQPSRYKAVERYAKFGLLQMAMRRQAILKYDRKTGRPGNTDEEAWVESMLATEFPEFRVGKPPGRWASSWSGKTAKQLANDSSRAIRTDQYEILFREWSEQTHAAPGALIATIFADFDVERIIAADDVRIAETVASAVMFFVDLLNLLHAIPVVPAEQQAEWMAQLLEDARKYGGVPPGAAQGAAG